MKPKVAFYWCASCADAKKPWWIWTRRSWTWPTRWISCSWPVALDFKEHDVEAMPDGSILASFINGAIRNSDQLKMAKLLRANRSGVAFGVCAQLGGIPGLANLSRRERRLRRGLQGRRHTRRLYKNNGHSLTLPEFYDTVVELGRVIDVDYYVPGCPPTPKIIGAALGALLGSELPPKARCWRRTRPCARSARARHAPREDAAEGIQARPPGGGRPADCLLAQGLACLGPGTRAGCEALCPRGNMPCTGCFGPTSRVRDYGAKALSALASVIDSDDEAEIARCWTPSRTRPDSFIGIACRPHSWAGGGWSKLWTIAESPSNQSPARRPRQDRDLPDGREWWSARISRCPSCADSRSSRRAARRRTCRRSLAHLRGLPTAITWRRPKRSDALYQVTPPPSARKIRELIYSTFSSRTRAALLLPGRPGFVVGPQARPPNATCWA